MEIEEKWIERLLEISDKIEEPESIFTTKDYQKPEVIRFISEVNYLLGYLDSIRK